MNSTVSQIVGPRLQSGSAQISHVTAAAELKYEEYLYPGCTGLTQQQLFFLP